MQQFSNFIHAAIKWFYLLNCDSYNKFLCSPEFDLIRTWRWKFRCDHIDGGLNLSPRAGIGLRQLWSSFIDSDKATKFCKFSALHSTYAVPVKSKVEISQNFMAFSNFTDAPFRVHPWHVELVHFLLSVLLSNSCQWKMTPKPFNHIQTEFNLHIPKYLCYLAVRDARGAWKSKLE